MKNKSGVRRGKKSMAQKSTANARRNETVETTDARDPTVFFFLKFFEQREYAQAFIAGQLYLNPLAYFKDLESTKDDGRADDSESPILWISPKSMVNVTVKV